MTLDRSVPLDRLEWEWLAAQRDLPRDSDMYAGERDEDWDDEDGEP